LGRAAGPELGRDEVDVDVFADVRWGGARLLVVLSRGQGPAAGRPEGVALTPVVVASGDSDHCSGLRPLGGACLPFPVDARL
jgi:hypothetical protein